MPGEDINLDAEIHNFSRKDVTTSYVTMQQVGHVVICHQATGETHGGHMSPGNWLVTWSYINNKVT